MARGLPKQNSRETEALRQELSKLERDRKTVPWIDGDGRFFQDVLIGNGESKSVHHGLKRRPRGWVAMSFRATGAISTHTPRESARSSTTLTLHNDAGAADVVFDLWVY